MHFGLIGYPLGHSFSRNYFNKKFETENLAGYHYHNFELPTIEEFPELLVRNPELIGLNVTIPHKESVIPYLDRLDKTAERIGAVNVIRINDGNTTGFNSDLYGFKSSLTGFIGERRPDALILGTGGASKAVAAALEDLEISFNYVSRNPGTDQWSYKHLDGMLSKFGLIINTTPLGTFPNIKEAPDIPYSELTRDHFLFDLVYNPSRTLFLKNAENFGAHTKNGLEMLELQAEKSWEIWRQ